MAQDSGVAANALPGRPRQRNNSTTWLLLSILFAPGLWAMDATLMSFFWLTNPFTRSRRRGAAGQQVPQLIVDPVALGTTFRTHWIRPWKIAFSLGVVAALVAPFASRSYKEHPTYSEWEPLTDQEISELRSLPFKPAPATQASYLSPADIADSAISDCLYSETTGHFNCKYELDAGGFYSKHLDLPNYIRINALVSSATFASTFMILMLLFGAVRTAVVLSRRYWSWLHA